MDRMVDGWKECRIESAIGRNTMKLFAVVAMGVMLTQLNVCASTGTGSQSSPMNRSTGLVAKGGTSGKKGTQAKKGYKLATFAGGCFWCMQPPFDKLKGVVQTTVGYTGGREKNPTYKQVAYGKTTHCEAIQIVYDPKRVTYKQLLHVFWRNIDPTAKNRQFADVGRHYRTSVFYHSKAQKAQAIASKKALAALGKFKRPIVTEIVKASVFYPAETYHQKYYLKNPRHYYRYRVGSGRAGFLKRHWGGK
jgi:peptide-methionine (S)-S-oxide reductase